MTRDHRASAPRSTPGQQWRAYHWLAVLPAAGMLGGLPFANRVHPLVLGLPFLFAWLVGWVIATSAIMGCILLLDRANAVPSVGGETTRDGLEARADDPRGAP